MTVSVLATGDAILTHPISANSDSGFVALVDLLRSTDVTITNVEMVFPGSDRHPSTSAHGTALGVDPEMLAEFEWLGIDLYGLANNHATDYGTDGLLRSLQHLERRGLPYAGAGRTLREARAPRYFDAPEARVALVAAGSSNARLSVAADPGIGDKGRPGIAPIRLQKTHFIREDRFEEFKEIVAETGAAVVPRGTTAPGIFFPYPDMNVYDPPPPGGFAIEGVHFVPANQPRVQTDALPRDVDALLASVDQASRQADVVVVALHCHEGVQGRWNNEVPAEFMQPLAHQLIDAGAHAVVAHGPHMLRGVEMYRDRPICYSLGNFVFNLETIPSFPVELYEHQGMPLDSTAADLYDRVTGYADESRFWESVLPLFVFADSGELVTLELHPITLGRELPRSRRGCPTLASVEDGRRILARLSSLSEPFGTRVEAEERDGRCIGRMAKA